jgi:hypothetical protein
MATLPNPHTWTAGDDATSGNLQTLTDGINFLKDPPRARAYQSAATTLTSGAAQVALALGSEDVDGVQGDNLHSTVTNTSRMTIVTAGRYRAIGQVTFVANATGYRTVALFKNGSTVAATRLQAGPTVTHFQQCVEEILCAAGDYIEVAAAQSSGGNLDTVAGQTSTFLHVVWVSNS